VSVLMNILKEITPRKEWNLMPDRKFRKRKKTPNWGVFLSVNLKWCAREESNLHTLAGTRT
jgi:hypothetical protein